MGARPHAESLRGVKVGESHRSFGQWNEEVGKCRLLNGAQSWNCAQPVAKQHAYAFLRLFLNQRRVRIGSQRINAEMFSVQKKQPVPRCL